LKRKARKRFSVVLWLFILSFLAVVITFPKWIVLFYPQPHRDIVFSSAYEYIPAMLEEFKKAQAQVTFFVTGSWAEKNPELLKQMSEAGHSIQNHAYKHVHFSSLSDAEAQAQIKKAEAVIEKIIGKKTRFFAPPLWRTK
jgi:peptidoglycan/xylan/chitin deacetylase (PgdA/CDA1 family)